LKEHCAFTDGYFDPRRPVAENVVRWILVASVGERSVPIEAIPIAFAGFDPKDRVNLDFVRGLRRSIVTVGPFSWRG